MLFDVWLIKWTIDKTLLLQNIDKSIDERLKRTIIKLLSLFSSVICLPSVDFLLRGYHITALVAL